MTEQEYERYVLYSAFVQMRHPYAVEWREIIYGIRQVEANQWLRDIEQRTPWWVVAIFKPIQ